MGKRELDFESLMADGPKLISFGLIVKLFINCDNVTLTVPILKWPGCKFDPYKMSHISSLLANTILGCPWHSGISFYINHAHRKHEFESREDFDIQV